MPEANRSRVRAATRRRERALARSVVLLVALLLTGCTDAQPPPGVAERLAALEPPREYAPGRDLYEARCVQCHGTYGLGTETGPPLVHRVYRTAHHGDEAFQIAVARGVRAHHWRFGDMAAIPGLTRDDVTAVTHYIRWLQREAGIE